MYTDAATRGELSQVSRGSSGPLAVLIPICKSAAWWALAQEERQAYFTRGRGAGHTALGRPFAARIYRRLRELLGTLRDAEQNPEWAFVERELDAQARVGSRPQLIRPCAAAKMR